MPSMSQIERTFCRSRPWGLFAERAVLPWALQGTKLHGDLLELGAGSGEMAAATLRQFPDIRMAVTDVDPVMVAAARRRLGHDARVTVQTADVTDLRFGDSSFDFVASYLMLHHVIEWRRALSETARVLRPGGRLVGYDLTATRAARLVHWADRSPHQLVLADELSAALDSTGLQTVHVGNDFGGHVVRFVAVKAP